MINESWFFFVRLVGSENEYKIRLVDSMNVELKRRIILTESAYRKPSILLHSTFKSLCR